MQRMVALQGGRNFRDLGGYSAADGRRVKWQQIYRSGTLTYLTDADHLELGPRSIRTICDLRSNSERIAEPAGWRAKDIVSLTWDYETSLLHIPGMKHPPSFTAERARAGMIDLYTRLPDAMSELYARLFAALADGRTPLLVNCAAGKDRTGVAVALVLTALGVPRETVLEDYILTNRVAHLHQEIQRRPGTGVGLGDGVSLLRDISSEARLSLLDASPQYLNATFDSIDRRYGSISHYLQLRLGMTPDRLQALRMHLLEASSN